MALNYLQTTQGLRSLLRKGFWRYLGPKTTLAGVLRGLGPQASTQNTLSLGYKLNTPHTLPRPYAFWPHVPAAEQMASPPLLPAPCHSSAKGMGTWHATLAAGAFHAAVKFSRAQMRQESQE